MNVHEQHDCISQRTQIQTWCCSSTLSGSAEQTIGLMLFANSNTNALFQTFVLILFNRKSNDIVIGNAIHVINKMVSATTVPVLDLL